MTASGSPQDEVSIFNATTIAALSVLAAIVAAAYTASLYLLPRTTSAKLRTFYIWHIADGLVHCILEASFLYNCFFSYTTLPAASSDYPHPASLSSAAPVFFLSRSDRLYGPDYGDNVFATLWREYAKADRRWGGADLTVISLEILTVFIGGPLAFYVAELIRRGGGQPGGERESARLWFWGSLLACGELYGGFMTFAPEWLSGNVNLATESFMKLWVYLVLFNVVWVFLPLAFLVEAYKQITASFIASGGKTVAKKTM